MFRFVGLFFLIKLISAKVPENELFPFGGPAGDVAINQGDDFVYGPVTLNPPFTLFNQTRNRVWVSNNGALSFDKAVSSYTTVCEPGNDLVITPFWTDIHNGQGFGGQTWARLSTAQPLRDKASNEIKKAYPLLGQLPISMVFIATWHKVPFYGASGCRGAAPSKRNTFQTILATTGTNSFVIFFYNDIQWTTSTNNGGNCSGLGGKAAKAGFDMGDRKNLFTIPGSCTAAIARNLDDGSNYGQPGRWIFRVESKEVVSMTTPAPITTTTPSRPLCITGKVYCGFQLQTLGYTTLDPQALYECDEDKNVIFQQKCTFWFNCNNLTHPFSYCPSLRGKKYCGYELILKNRISSQNPVYSPHALYTNYEHTRVENCTKRCQQNQGGDSYCANDKSGSCNIGQKYCGWELIEQGEAVWPPHRLFNCTDGSFAHARVLERCGSGCFKNNGTAACSTIPAPQKPVGPPPG